MEQHILYVQYNNLWKCCCIHFTVCDNKPFLWKKYEESITLYVLSHQCGSSIFICLFCLEENISYHLWWCFFFLWRPCRKHLVSFYVFYRSISLDTDALYHIQWWTHHFLPTSFLWYIFNRRINHFSFWVFYQKNYLER